MEMVKTQVVCLPTLLSLEERFSVSAYGGGLVVGSRLHLALSVVTLKGMGTSKILCRRFS
jgi:hypothetical protein